MKPWTALAPMAVVLTLFLWIGGCSTPPDGSEKTPAHPDGGTVTGWSYAYRPDTTYRFERNERLQGQASALIFDIPFTGQYHASIEARGQNQARTKTLMDVTLAEQIQVKPEAESRQDEWRPQNSPFELHSNLQMVITSRGLVDPGTLTLKPVQTQEDNHRLNLANRYHVFSKSPDWFGPVLPSQPVEPGTTWTAPQPLPRPGRRGPIEVDTRYTFQGLERLNGHEHAVIDSIFNQTFALEDLVLEADLDRFAQEFGGTQPTGSLTVKKDRTTYVSTEDWLPQNSEDRITISGTIQIRQSGGVPVPVKIQLSVTGNTQLHGTMATE